MIEEDEIFTIPAIEEYFEILEEEEKAEEAYRAYLEEMGFL